MTGPETLRALDVDMNAISDTVMTLAVVALFAPGMTRIRNVGHIRHKETDRIAAVAAELRKLGATVDEQPDGLLIIPPARIAICAGEDRHLRRSPHGDGVRASGFEGEGRDDPGTWLRGEDVSGILGGPGTVDRYGLSEVTR